MTLILTRGMTLLNDVPICVVLGRASFNQDLKAVLPKREDIKADFIPYLLLANKQKIHDLVDLAGHGTGRLATDALLNLEVAVPPTQLREDAVGLFKALNDKIQLNHQINQTLEQMAQAIFQSWFVDFEPVKAKIAALQAGGSAEAALLAAMQVISGKATDQLAQMQAEQPEQYAELRATAELFPSAMQDSELGEIPEGWAAGTVSDLLELNPRRTLKKGTVAPYLDMKNVPTSGHLADEVSEREMGSGTKFINGDTLLARITPCLENGKTAFVDFLRPGETGWGSTEYIVLRPKSSYPVSLGYFIARNEVFRSAAIQSMTGTSGRQRASAKALADLCWLIYPQQIVERFDAVAGGYLRLAKSYGDQIKSLAEARDTLLPKLLSGELTLPDIEALQSELENAAHATA